MTVVHNAFIL